MMKSKFTFLLSICLLWLGMATATAQVTGTVVEAASGEPIIGATVLEAGSTNGTITDFDGNFVLNVAEGTSIQFSYIGFQTQTLPAKNGMVVRLAEESVQLTEVVAIGYGSQKKKEVTGSVASIKAEDFNAGVKSSPVGLLQGKVAGLNVINTTSDPTQGGYSIQIRGFSTLDKGTGSEPLYIVDGVPVSNISNISPDEIASMDVLKDGSAAAIYGTRGTNGVIIITTKRGDNFSDVAKTQVEYAGYASIAYRNGSNGMATPSQFRDLAALSDGKVVPTIYDDGTGKQYNTDWLKEITRPVAVTHSHNVAVTGSSRKFNYRASASFKNAEGIAKNNNRQEIIGKFAANQKALEGWLELQYDLSYLHYRNDYACTDFKYAAIVNPTYPIYDSSTPSGYFMPQGTGQINPVENLNNQESYQDGNYFRGGVKATVNIKAVEGLKVSGFAAIEEGDNHNFYYNGIINTNASGSGKAGRQQDFSLNQLYEATIDYVGSWSNHNLALVGGFSYQKFMWDGQKMDNKGFPTESTKYYIMENGTAELKDASISSWRGSYSLAGLFLRANYNYKEKYLVSASIRREGSSRFGANHKWGWFPAVSLGWRISGEDFMANQDWCNDLKMRIGFGITGNSLGQSLRSVALLSKAGSFWYNGQYVETYSVTQNVNPDLRWEKKYEYNFGVDFSFLNSRLYGSLDAYYRNTRDLLWDYEVPTPPYQYATLLANAGQMSSYGVELALSGVAVKTANWTWTTTPTVAWNRCYIDKLSDPSKGFNYTQTTSGGIGGENGLQNTNTQILTEGQAIGTFYGYKYYATKSDGTMVYETPAGGYTSSPNESQRMVLANAQPMVTFGWNNVIRYKNLDITLFFRGVAGNKILNVMRLAYGPQASQSMNVFMYDVTKNKDGVVYPNKSQFSDYYLENGSYLKLDNITVGYTWNFKDNNYIQSLRLYGTAQNVFTVTAYSGQDPEVNTTSVWSAGIDNNNFYPRTGSAMIGVNMTLF